jgi:hypothetical protein
VDVRDDVLLRPLRARDRALAADGAGRFEDLLRRALQLVAGR